ncbi:MAG TPA: hypothetical protein VKE30_08040 [Chthoniobacterales bacterium]|nr:hypothetical protein [Chthoniobacterales bacterium]
MQRDRQRWLDTNELTIDFDMIVFGWLRAEGCADAAIDRNPAGSDQLVTFSTRTDSGRGEITV